MIEIASLSKKYGEFTAVNALTLRVEPGEIFAFLGPNGAGKTTTIRMLMGFLVPTSGGASIDGLDCFRDRVEVKRRVGFLPDEPRFYDYMTARETVELMAEMHGMPRPRARERADALLAQFALSDAAGEYAVNFSTGMKKRLALACALVHEPKVLILDEPTNGLDPRAAHEVDVLIRDLGQQGKTVFLSTHLLDRAEKLCSRVAIIDRGQLVAHGPIAELKAKLARGGSLEELFLAVTEPAAAPA
jgi:ABC-2 type transport system ATP-binding protein